MARGPAVPIVLRLLVPVLLAQAPAVAAGAEPDAAEADVLGPRGPASIDAALGANADGGSSAPKQKSFWQQHFKSDFTLVGDYNNFKPSMLGQNPSNAVFRIQHHDGLVTLRPNFRLTFKHPDLRLTIDPRYSYRNQKWDYGIGKPPAGTENPENRFYVNQYTINLGLGKGVSVAAIRDYHLWGPCYSGSPSNVFTPIKGLTTPLAELPGRDYVRASWVVNDALSFEYLYNYKAKVKSDSLDLDFVLGPGTQRTTDFLTFGEFQKAQSLRLTRHFKSASITLVGGFADEPDKGGPLRRPARVPPEQRRWTFGSYGQWTANDAILIYWDGAVRPGGSGLYPVLDNEAIPERFIGLGGYFDQTLRDSNTLKPEVILGVSYTDTHNVTFYLEYLYNAPGYDSAQRAALATLVSLADRVYVPDPPPGSGPALAERNLGNSYLNRLRYRNRNQVMLQITKSFGDLGLTSHNIYAIDDHSGFSYVSASYRLNRFEFVFSGQKTFGPDNGEYKTALDYTFNTGVRFIVW